MKSALNPFLLAVLSGLLLACSWPTYGSPLLIFFAFIPLLLAEKQLRESYYKVKLKVWACAYITFVTWNAITTWWLYYASGFGMFFAVLVNALLMSVLFLMYHIVAKRIATKWSLFFLVCLWLSFEKFHLNWDFSWPWLNLGNVFANNPKWIQWYEYTGAFGGSLWVLATNVVAFYAISNAENAKSGILRIFPKVILMIAVPIVFSLWIYNIYEIKGKTKEVIVLQPNVDPYTEKYDTPNFIITKGLLEQADSLVTPKTEFIIAPETVLAESAPFDAFYNSPSRALMTNYIAKHPKVQLLWGIDTYHFIYDPKDVSPSSNIFRPGMWVDFYNAALFINEQPDFQKYYKSKLVVGIENLPYKSILEPLLGNVMLDLGGTISTKTTQKERIPFIANDGTKVAPIICYESVYGEYVSGFVKNNAQFLAIITNDAWWNETQGHKQHLTFASLRAIETRRDIARSANTGISAFINQKGDIVSRTKYGEKTALKGTVHLNSDMTFYVFSGDYIAYLAIFFLSLLTGYILVKKRKVLEV
ncbi:apolipoprotein N-acyltransferase [Flavobacterium sp.]|uniref:apolipoprotein N-acyltransferase n=1 Tax=Flavobacterium sp. TaxID=239 RepID=UPI002612CD55|nr:apolipoprotein N-acyltransferase [Flavobacterium sp.]